VTEVLREFVDDHGDLALVVLELDGAHVLLLVLVLLLLLVFGVFALLVDGVLEERLVDGQEDLEEVGVGDAVREDLLVFDLLSEELIFLLLAGGVGFLQLDLAFLHEFHELGLEQEVKLLQLEALVEDTQVNFIADRDEAEYLLLVLGDEGFVVLVLALLDQLSQEELTLGLLDLLAVGFEDHTQVVVVFLVGLADLNHGLEIRFAVVEEADLGADVYLAFGGDVMEV